MKYNFKALKINNWGLIIIKIKTIQKNINVNITIKLQKNIKVLFLYLGLSQALI